MLNQTLKDSAVHVPTQERNDCTVRALSTCVDIPYNIAYDIVARLAGREPRGRCMFADVAEKLPDVLQPVPIENTFIPVHEFVNDHQTGRYVGRISGHVFAILDGCVHDDMEIIDYDQEPMINVWKLQE